MAQYCVKLRVYDTIEVSVEAPEGCLEQDVLDRARIEAAVFGGRREWRVDEERSRVALLD